MPRRIPGRCGACARMYGRAPQSCALNWRSPSGTSALGLLETVRRKGMLGAAPGWDWSKRRELIPASRQINVTLVRALEQTRSAPRHGRSPGRAPQADRQCRAIFRHREMRPLPDSPAPGATVRVRPVCSRRHEIAGPTPAKRRQDPKSRDLQEDEEGEEHGNDLMVIGKQPHPSHPSGME